MTYQKNGKADKKPLFEAIDPETAIPADVLDVTSSVIEYVQLALDAPDTAQYLFGELSALVSAAAIVFGRPPAEVVNMLVKSAPDTWPADGLQQLIDRGLVEVPDGG